MRLELHNVSKTFSRGDHPVPAVQELSLQLESGQFAALCGPSGCGKSTLLLVCGGLLRPEAGMVMLSGHDLYSQSGSERARFRAANVGFVFQQFYLIPYLNVLDNVLAASLGLPANSAEDRRQVRKRAHGLVERFGLGDRVLHLPSELSTGESQRVALARALLNRPQVLLADEPTGNLDAENSEVVLDYLREFTGSDGAVLLVTHDAAAADCADRVLPMEAGRLVMADTPEGSV